MRVLILKLGASGDVVRTTSLLRRFEGDITWITAAKNIDLLKGLRPDVKALSWEERHWAVDGKYDLAINLEDTVEVGEFLGSLKFNQLYGAYLDAAKGLRYTDDSRGWFDLSLISVYGRQRADELKFLNRRTYQDLIFGGLGYAFSGERYLLPDSAKTSLSGDIALAPTAGPVWPMKNWAYYPELKRALEAKGLVVNVLGPRPTLLEHLADVRNHRCLVCGDSLPMHLALGSGTRCVTLFSCTSPWEIFDYGIQEKLVSPLLGEFFYKRDNDKRATTAISVTEVFNAVMRQLEARDASPDPRGD